jgi:hypothetical protein
MSSTTARKTALTPNAPKATSSATERQPVQAVAKAETTFEQIRQRAYEIYLARGGQRGDELQDWYEAERDLCSRKV